MTFPWSGAQSSAVARLAGTYNGTAYNSVTNPGGLAQGGHIVNFVPALQDVATAGQAAADAATAAGVQAARLSGTSASSVAVGTGSKTFTTQADKFFDVGSFVVVRSAAAPTTNWMYGQVSAYSGTSLTVDVQATGGAGTFTDWLISLSGARGITGSTGPSGTVDIGTTTTLSSGASATVTATGTSTARILSFGIPTGPVGATGPAAVGAKWVSSFASIASSTFSAVGSGGPAYLEVNGFYVEGDCKPFRMRRMDAATDDMDTSAYDGKLATTSNSGTVKWRYHIDANYMQFLQTGAKSDDATDCVPYWNAWKAYVVKINLEAWWHYGSSGPKPNTGPTLDMRHKLFDGWYFSDTVNLKEFACNVIGEARNPHRPFTGWRVPNGVIHLIIDDWDTLMGDFAAVTTSAVGSSIEGIMFYRTDLGGPGTSDFNIFVRTKAYIRNCDFSFAAKNAILVYGDSAGSAGGNANHGIIDNCNFSYCGESGVRLIGSDANAWNCTNNHYYTMGLSGIRDESFLGNNHRGFDLDRYDPDSFPYDIPSGVKTWGAAGGKVYHVGGRFEKECKYVPPGTTGPFLIDVPDPGVDYYVNGQDVWVYWYTDAGQADVWDGPSATYTVSSGVYTPNTQNRCEFSGHYVEGIGSSYPFQLHGRTVWMGGGASDQVIVARNCEHVGNVIDVDNVRVSGAYQTMSTDEAVLGDNKRLYTQIGSKIGALANVFSWFRKTGGTFNSRWHLLSTHDDEYVLTSHPTLTSAKALVFTGPGTLTDTFYNATIDISGWLHFVYLRIGALGFSRMLTMRNNSPTGTSTGVGDIHFAYTPYAGGYAGWQTVVGANASGGAIGVPFGPLRLAATGSSQTPGTIAANGDTSGTTQTISVAAPFTMNAGDFIKAVSYNGNLNGCQIAAWFSGANTVSYYFYNPSSASKTPTTGNVSVLLEYFSV